MHEATEVHLILRMPNVGCRVRDELVNEQNRKVCEHTDIPIVVDDLKDWK